MTFDSMCTNHNDNTAATSSLDTTHVLSDIFGTCRSEKSAPASTKSDACNFKPDTQLSTPLAREWYRQSEQNRVQPLDLSKDCEYTVKFGDCLWTIAERALKKEGVDKPGGKQIEDTIDKIVLLNSDAHPSLKCNKNLILPGWKLRMPLCEDECKPEPNCNPEPCEPKPPCHPEPKPPCHPEQPKPPCPPPEQPKPPCPPPEQPKPPCPPPEQPKPPCPPPEQPKPPCPPPEQPKPPCPPPEQPKPPCPPPEQPKPPCPEEPKPPCPEEPKPCPPKEEPKPPCPEEPKPCPPKEEPKPPCPEEPRGSGDDHNKDKKPCNESN